MRYPRLFGNDHKLMPNDFVVSNVDLSATIFDMIGVELPSEYKMDGTSWLDEVQSLLKGHEANTSSQDPCCELRYIDIWNSRSIMTADYQYIFRSNNLSETRGNPSRLYQYFFDEEQLYDLNADPDEQHNLIDSDRVTKSSLSNMTRTFRLMMRQYIDEMCPLGPDDGECLKPSFNASNPVSAPTVEPAMESKISMAVCMLYNMWVRML